MTKHETKEPVRWTDPESDGPKEIAELFRNARNDVSAERLARVEAKLGIRPARRRAYAKHARWIGYATIAIGVALAAWFATRSIEDELPVSRVVELPNAARDQAVP